MSTEVIDFQMRLDGNAFRDRRIALGFDTREQLAQEIGVAEETVKSWELAKRPIPLYAIRCLERLEMQKRKGARHLTAPHSDLPST